VSVVNEDKILKVLERLLAVSERSEKNSEHALHVLRKIEHELAPKSTQLSQSAAIQFSGDVTMPNNVLALNVGQKSTASPITFLTDGVTPSGATYSAATYTFSDPSATVALNSDGVTATVTGVAPSTGPVGGSVSFTATDTDGAVSTWTVPFTVTTSAVTPPPPPSQLSQSAALQFSTPA
jgi:hypothetical protein